MNSNYINFQMISKALSVSLKALQEEHYTEIALLRVKAAQEDLQQAFTFSLSKK